MLHIRSTFFTIIMLAAAAMAQTPYLLSDLDRTLRGTRGSEPSDFMLVGNKVFFLAGFGTSNHLYVHDLQTNQTVRLTPRRSRAKQFVPVGSQFVVSVFDLWFKSWYLYTTDGTVAGTKAVVALPSEPRHLTAAGSRVYFIAIDSTAGRELFTWDGNSLQVLDIEPGIGSSHPRSLTASGNELFFSAVDATSGRELWRTNGTPAGTVRVADIVAGQGSSFPTNISARFDATSKQHTIVFAAFTPNEGIEPWTSDGDPKGTTRIVKNINPLLNYSYPTDFTYDAANKRYFFLATTIGEGQELWRTDLTPNGTALVKDVRPGAQGSIPALVGVHQGQAFFRANDGKHGSELWTSDGTAQGTRMVLDLRLGTESGLGNALPLLTTSGTKPRLFFHGHRTSYWALWTSDGTAAGTSPVTSINPLADAVEGMIAGPSGSALFAASDGIHGSEPWTSDGTATGTKMLDDVGLDVDLVGATHSSSPRGGISRLAHVRFFASERMGLQNLEVDYHWGSGGTTSNTFRIGKVSSGSDRQDLTELEGGIVVWTALDQSDNRRLQTNRGFLSTATNAANLTAVGERLFFTAEDPKFGNELWTSLGTPETTQMVKDIHAGGSSSNPRDLIGFQGKVFFVAANDLWCSDGTAAGTIELKAIGRGPMFAAGGYLYFSAIDKIELGTGRELWKTDGTIAGTTLVKDINPGKENSTPYPLAAIGDTVYLVATDKTHGRELWKSDGTLKGTVLVKDIRAGTLSSFINQIAVSGNRLFFDAVDHRGREPWVSDGTAEGTFLLKDIQKGFQPSLPGPFFATGKKEVWFAATSAEYGRELWKTDGTQAGTTLVGDIIPGPFSSDPEILGIAESDKPRLLLAATDWVKGRELFALDLPGATRTIGQGCAQAAPPPTLAVDMVANPVFVVGKLSGRGVRANGHVFVLVAAKPSQAVFLPGCSIYVGSSFTVLGPYQANNGEWEKVMLVNASVPGRSFAWQGIVWPSPGPLGFDVTNGVITTF